MANFEVFGEKKQFNYLNLPLEITDKVINGDVLLYHYEGKDLGLLEVVKGSIDFSLSEITSLLNVKNIYENCSLASSEVVDLGKLEKVGGDLILSKNIKSLQNLKMVFGSIYFNSDEDLNFGALERVGKNVYFLNNKQGEFLKKKFYSEFHLDKKLGFVRNNLENSNTL